VHSKLKKLYQYHGDEFFKKTTQYIEIMKNIGFKKELFLRSLKIVEKTYENH